MANLPSYPFKTLEFGTPLEVAPGIHWLRMPMPFPLDHINLWLFKFEYSHPLGIRAARVSTNNRISRSKGPIHNPYWVVSVRWFLTSLLYATGHKNN